MIEDTNSDIRPPPLHQNGDIAQMLWNSTFTPKIKHFIWRVLSGAIAIKNNLIRRDMVVNPNCERCVSMPEDANHVFFTCPYAQAVWRISGVPYSSIFNSTNNALANISYILLLQRNVHLEEFDKQYPLWILWRLWKARNEYIFCKRIITMEMTIQRAREDTAAWISARLCLTPILIPSQQTVHMGEWKPPPRGWVKCNYDASFYRNQSTMGFGWIIRDEGGNFVQGGSGISVACNNAEEAECTGLLWAMQAAWGFRFQKVIFEGDCLSVITNIAPTSTNIRLARYMEDISLWKQVFHETRFAFTRREGNKCADKLAKEALASTLNFNSFSECPVFLQSLYNSDKHNL